MRTRSMIVCLALLVTAQWAMAAEKPSPKATRKSEPEAASKAYRLFLPEEIPAVAGIETNIYFDNVVLALNSSALVFDVNCAKGQHQRERWTWTPMPKDIGRHKLTLDVCDETMKVIASAQTKVRVVAADEGAGKEITCLIIGDSLTAASAYPDRVRQLFATPKNAKLTMVGTSARGNPATGLRHEGYGGWACHTFVTRFTKNPDPESKRRQTSPFVFEQDGKPVFDFPRYVKEQAPAKGIDFVTIALGCNDTFSSTEATIEERIDAMFGYLGQLIAGIHAARADTTIGIVSLVPPAGTQDAFGANYRCGQTRWQYRRNQHRVLERTWERYANRQKERIHIIPAYVNLDTINGYPARSMPAHANSATKILRLCNGVHPSRGGYCQMGDSIYCWIKGQIKP